MKIISLLFFAACLQVSAHGYGQKITLAEKDAPLQKVLREIHNQTGFEFFYNDELLQKAKRITIDVKDASLKDVLELCFLGQPFDFVIQDKSIVVKQKAMIKANDLSAPPGEIHGTITNAQGVPLAGANIIIKRTKRGTQTSANGEFTLKNVHPDDIIIMSYIGYKTLAVKVAGGKEFPLVMEEAKDELDKVVIQAYGTTTQRLATGSIATVTKEEIERQPVTNPLQALEGKVPGLLVTQTSGFASAPFTVEIRGRNTISDVPADPLYIIDGVPLTVLEVGGIGSSYGSGSLGFTQNGMNGPAIGQSPFFSINPSDIESITVLKDADATAIYGSRGANGVIILTTKKGKAGKTKFDMNVYEGIDVVTRYFDLLNTQQYLAMRREAFKNDNITITPYTAYDLLVWDTTRYTNWQKYIYGNMGKTTDAQFSLSGGNQQTTFRIGAGYRHLTDITTAKGATQRGSIQFNLAHKSSDQRLSIDFTNFYSVASNTMINVGGSILLPPNAPPAFDSKGNLNYSEWDATVGSSPFSSLLQPYSATTYFINSKVNLKYNLWKQLSVSTNLGYSHATVTQQQSQPISSLDPATNPKGSSQFGYNDHINWIVEPQLEYNAFINKGKLNVIVGGSSQSVALNGNTITGSGYTNDNLLGSISNAPVRDASDVYLRFKYAAMFGRVNYNWENKYILNLSARRDGSSRFGPGKQFGNFGALGAAWVFSEEDFIKKHIPLLSFGKLRGSYGSTGNDQIGDYKYLTRWSGTGFIPYQGGATYVPLQHANPDYQWEVNKKLEVALDLNFLKDRVSMEFAWYRNRCGNQLISYSLPDITGFNSVTANSLANIQNRGMELTLTGQILDKKELSWIVHFNIGMNRNKLLAYPNLETSPYANAFVVGQSVTLSHLLRYTGIDPQTGQYSFQDKNKDAVIIGYQTKNSDLYSYDFNPRYDGGLSSDLTWKNWNLNLFFHFRKRVGPNAFGFLITPGEYSNEPVQVLNRWQKAGDNAEFARFTTVGATSDGRFTNSTGAYTDASFIRLQNLSLSYDLPRPLMKKAGISSCRVYVRGQNLFVITKYFGTDPEAGFSLPLIKSFTMGLQLSF